MTLPGQGPQGRAPRAVKPRAAVSAIRGPRGRAMAGLALIVLVCLAPSSMPGPVSAATCTGWNSSRNAPSTIRVLRTSGPAAGNVQVVNFRAYVETVMPSEWTSYTPAAALRAGAIAIKQYAWYWTINWRGKSVGGACYDVVDSTNDQVYNPEARRPSTSHLAAVEATWDATVRRSDRFFATGYRAGSHVNCGTDADTFRLYQNSAMECARDGKSWDEILRLYYGPNLDVISGGVPTATPTPTPTPQPTPSDLAPPVGTVVTNNPAGDSTGDGLGDVIVIPKPLDASGVATRVYAGGQVPPGGGPVTVALAHPAADTLFRAASDVTGDRLEDLVVLIRRPDGGLRIDVAAAVPGGALAPALTWWEGVVGDLGWADGVPIRFLAGDLDGDGLGDAAVLVGAPDPANVPSILWRLPGTASSFGAPAAFWTGIVDVNAIIPIAADLDGDSRTDVILQTDLTLQQPPGAGVRYDVLLAQGILTGGTATAATTWLQVPDLTAAQARTAVTDINGDGRADLVVDRPLGPFGSQFVGLISNGAAFTTRTLWQNTKSFRWIVSRVAGADVNGDGRGDLVIMYNVGTAGTRFYRFLSTGGSLKSSGSTTDPTLPWAGAAVY